ncbi:hypothetical protein SAMN05216567_102354 [Variovorax sp. OK605]|jgi:hypothetical protein|uniref:hypothetical protein n=1 Tax=unclassified Variovorax TaxID=663243 RepID=UPI0008B4CBA4|nr:MULTISPECIES: hypothetical protein [unclassified Variovorax]SEJ19254.1 hypothetical protein SAMN05518853_101910 [Variovorax sp. OK202]SFC10163.1 hypothetical protein SAMN05444746_101910 [Variovorax sp. OK212]SFO72859.1 hypothetical protein SAMN05216567_102354 [Variovorax sp. OK605]
MNTQALLRWLPAALAWAAAGTVCAQGVLVPPAPPAPPQDTLTRAATSVGIKRCLPAISRLSSLTVQGSRSHDVLLDWDRKRPDAGPMFSLIGMQYPNAGVAASITAIPDESGACTVSAERISVAPFTCESVAQQELASYKMTRLLPNYAVYTDAKEPTSSVSLIDSPPGCLIIRRYVEYGWKDPAAVSAAPPPGKR